MNIRRATVSDAPRISALLHDLSKPFLLSPAGEGAQRFLATLSEAAIQGYVSASNFDYLVAEDCGDLAGVVALRDSSHLFHLFVAVPFQGRGLGRELWRTVQSRAAQNGHAGIFTVNASLQAVPVYERFGFVANGAVVHTNGVAFQPMRLNPTMHIRPYLESDEAAVIALWQSCALTRPWNDPHQDIARKLQVQRHLFLVGEVSNRIVATVMAGFDGHRGWINNLAVHPDVQRRGLATQLMKACEELLLDAGCPKINLQVRITNQSAVAFYQRLGFAQDEVLSFGKRIIDDASSN